MAVREEHAAHRWRWGPGSILVSRARWTPAAILVLALMDWLCSSRLGIAFTDWWHIAGAVVLLLAVGWFYTTLRVRPALAEAALYAGLWVAFSATGACSTYLAASLALPLHDDLFAAADAALGFDWLAWAHALGAQAWLHGAIVLVYRSLGVQIIVSILVLAFTRVPGRNEELLRGAIVSLLLTSVAFAAAPSLGPIPWYGYDGASADTAAYLPPLRSLRAHGSATYSMLEMQGIIPFPSYHVVLAMLLTHGQRGNRWTFGPFLLANVAMLPTIPTEGSHYLVDMLAGAAIGAVTIAAVRAGTTPVDRAGTGAVA